MVAKNKKIYGILITIIMFAILLIYVDGKLVEEYTNPYDIGKKFAFSYMIKTSKNMKTWAHKDMHGIIDNLKYEGIENDEVDNIYYDHFTLICAKRVGDTLICSYGLLMDDVNPIPIYTVLLKPNGPLSFMERAKIYMHNGLKIARKFIDLPTHPDRWLVYNFLDKNEFNYMEYITSDLSSSNSEDGLDNKYNIMMEHENNWGNSELIKQNSEMQSLYNDYYGLK